MTRYGNKVPTQFILRMMEHPCVEVKAYLSQKMKLAFSELNETNPDLYIYYTKHCFIFQIKFQKARNIYITLFHCF